MGSRTRLFVAALLVIAAPLPLGAASVEPALVKQVDNWHFGTLTGFGAQVAAGSGYTVTRAEWNGQRVDVYSTATGDFVRTISVASGYFPPNVEFTESMTIHSGNLLVGAAKGFPPGLPAVASDAQLFDLATGGLVRSFAAPADADKFGFNLAYDGRFAVIGDPGKRRVHVFDANTGQVAAVLNGAPSTGVYNTGFGVDVALSDGLLAVSDPDSNSVLLYNTENWQLARTITRANDQPWFGRSIDLEGDKLVVAAYWDGLGHHDQATFLYDLATDVVVELGGEFDPYGRTDFDVEISDGVVAVASSTYPTTVGLGRVGLYDAETGAELAIVGSPPSGPYSAWGRSVALDGPTLVIGDKLNSNFNGTYQDRGGSLYIYDIPEPASVVLLAVAGLVLAAVQECKSLRGRAAR